MTLATTASMPVDQSAAPTVWRETFAVVYLVGTMGLFAELGTIAQLPWLGGVLFMPLYAVLVGTIGYAALTGSRVPMGRAVAVLALVSCLLTTALLSYKPIGAAFNVALLGFDLLFALWLASWANLDTFRNLLVRALLLMLLLAVPVALVNPSVLIYFDPLERPNVLGLSNFKGLFPHKIHAGLYNAIGAVCAWSLYRSSRVKVHALLAGILLLVTASSGSSLALVSLMLGVVGAWFVLRCIERFGLVILGYLAGWMLLLVMLVFLFDLYPKAMLALGRDPSLTGRVPIWQFGFQFFAEHPFFGGGFGVFFDSDQGSPAQALWFSTPWYRAPSFHSGYLQLLAETGLVGSVGFSVLLATAVVRSIESHQPWFARIVAICVVANTVAALFVTHRSLLFLIICYAAFAVLEKQLVKNDA